MVMDTRAVRADLEQLKRYLQAGLTDQALAALDQALDELRPDQLLTTTEAAQALGIRSVNTLKVLLRSEGVATVSHGNRTMIPLAEVERLRDSLRVRQIRRLDRRHDEIDDLGGPDGLSDTELDDLEAGRPGRLPWAASGVAGR
jgi:hypothetical protein